MAGTIAPVYALECVYGGILGPGHLRSMGNYGKDGLLHL